MDVQRYSTPETEVIKTLEKIPFGEIETLHT